MDWVRIIPGDQRWAGWVISGIGVALAGLSIWYLIVVKALYLGVGTSNEPFALVLKVIEVALLAGFSVVLIYAGYWLAISPFDNERAWWAGLWTMLGLSGIVAIVGFVTAFRVFQGREISEPTLIQEMLLAAGGGALAGLLIGISTVRETAEAERAKDQRNTLLFVNELLRHNVLNGMNVVLAYADQIESNIDGDDNPGTVHRDLETIRSNSENIVELIENVRALVQSVSGETSLSPTALEPVLRKEVTQARNRYPSATFTLEIPNGTEVVADELLGTVFQNLLTNAVEHNDSDHPTVDLGLEEDSDCIRIRVEDNGPGIPDDRKETYFAAGEQHEGSVGQGLGLYLVDTLVTRYDGDVWIEDSRPTGTVVTVELARP